ncbi:hypothetical protein [Nocardioides sp.]|jgi:hypothetical protein|uniref:hypothetical protein n=1 Tax=Nocardioides sp. TaxID=35761 RepID=UPI002615C7E8|nr:hypothetical protein [Nocardioides sp.]
MLSTLVTLAAAAEAEHHESVNHWIIGGIAIAILLGMLLVLMAFARGREHS